MINYFISDLHLEADNPTIANIFFQFLQDVTKPATLYILGDFFEAWIGDDDLTPFHQSIITALKKATEQGLVIYIMHGNRDFLLGKSFQRQTGCRLLPDEYVVTLGGVPTLLMHGDTLCTEDKAYLRFRKKTRNWLFKKIFLLKSLASRRKIADNMRENSKKYTKSAPQNIMDVTPSAVEAKMRQHHVMHMIHGHTHRPAVHEFMLDGQNATRTVLAAWHVHGSVLVFNEEGKQEIVTLSADAL